MIGMDDVTLRMECKNTHKIYRILYALLYNLDCSPVTGSLEGKLSLAR